MIYSILQSYLSTFLLVAGISLVLLMAGLYFIFKRSSTKTAGCRLKTRGHDSEGEISQAQQQPSQLPSQRKLASSESVELTPDLTAIAGDDLMATQLDLARAYIETGKNQLATAILKQVLMQGNQAEQQEAQMLLQGQ